MFGYSVIRMAQNQPYVNALFDEMAAFSKAHLSRHFAMRQDYGMYEYTTYVYRDALE